MRATLQCLAVGCTVVLAVHLAAAPPDAGPASRPTTGPTTAASTLTQEQCVEIARGVLKPEKRRYSVLLDGSDDGRYVLVTFHGRRRSPEDELPTPRLMRVTVDSWTGESGRPMGPYTDREVEAIAKDRAAGVMSPEEAIALADREVAGSGRKVNVGGGLRADRCEIDLVGERYYILRYPETGGPNIPGTPTPEWTLHVYVDGLKREVTYMIDR